MVNCTPPRRPTRRIAVTGAIATGMTGATLQNGITTRGTWRDTEDTGRSGIITCIVTSTVGNLGRYGITSKM